MDHMGKEKYTIGGQLEIYAQHWTAENHQKLGEILYKMLLGNKEIRAKARVDFFTLKRSFMEDEWEEYIKKVDNYRSSLGVKTLSDFMIESYSEMFNINCKFSPEPEKFQLPEQGTFLKTDGLYKSQYHEKPIGNIDTVQKVFKSEPVIPEEGLQTSLF